MAYGTQTTSVPSWGAALIQPNGGRMLNGISDSYNEYFPPELKGFLSEKLFLTTMKRINEYLRLNHPGEITCECKDDVKEKGIEICPKLLRTEELFQKLHELIEDENRTTYRNTKLRWCLEKRMNFRTHRLEFVIDIQLQNTFGCDC